VCSCSLADQIEAGIGVGLEGDVVGSHHSDQSNVVGPMADTSGDSICKSHTWNEKTEFYFDRAHQN
jgi:hypothetical protein